MVMKSLYFIFLHVRDKYISDLPENINLSYVYTHKFHIGDNCIETTRAVSKKNGIIANIATDLC